MMRTSSFRPVWVKSMAAQRLGAMFTAAMQDFPATRGEPHDIAVVLP